MPNGEWGPQMDIESEQNRYMGWLQDFLYRTYATYEDKEGKRLPQEEVGRLVQEEFNRVLRLARQWGIENTDYYARFKSEFVEEPEPTLEEQYGLWERQAEKEWQLGARITPFEQWQMQREGQMTEFQRAQVAQWEKEGGAEEITRQLETARLELLAGLTEEEDWIKRWVLMHPEQRRAISPREQPWQPTGAYATYPEMGERAETAYQAQRGQWLSQQQLQGMVGRGQIEQAPIYPGMGGHFGGGGAFYPSYPRQVTQPIAPPAPGWLPQFVPGLTAGQQITRQPVPTPSGQQWATMSPTQQAMLGGYAEWAGGRSMEDIYAQMLRMQPQTPYGAGAQRWQPARQY